MGSILIPAYNEAAVIARTLHSVLASVGDAEHEIMVVCNACIDETAKVARSVSPRVQVIETEQAGKCNAINLGERHLSSYPRIYLDADIEVSPNFVSAIFGALQVAAPKAAWSNVRYDLSRSSWIVRAYYRVWTALPYNRPGRIGVGVYAMNEAGRSRFETFPEIISDDGFVRGMFPQEDARVIVEDCHTVVRAPRDLRSLLAVRTRSRMGVLQMQRSYPEVLGGHYGATSAKGGSTAGLPVRLWPLLPIYAAIVLYTKRRASQRLRANQSAWDRDLSARPGSTQP